MKRLTIFLMIMSMVFCQLVCTADTSAQAMEEDSGYNCTLYAPDGRMISVPGSEADNWVNVGWYEVPVTTIYAADGRSAVVPTADVYAYLGVGWFLSNTVTMYSAAGDTIEVALGEVEAYKAVGWYDVPVTTVYADDGRSIVVASSDVGSWVSVGWRQTYEETLQTLYAPDGRTVTVYKAEVPSYKSVGWYDNLYDAQASAPGASSGSSSYSGGGYNPSPDGGVYRTPYGKRYHLDPNCGGKNSYRTTLAGAKQSGLTPCAKCAY